MTQTTLAKALRPSNTANSENGQNTQKYWWLDEKSNSDIWYFKQNGHASNGSFTVNWEVHIQYEKPNLRRWQSWKEYAQKLVIAIMESDETNVQTPITLAGYTREVRALCLWLCFEHHLHSVGEVTKHHIEQYEKYIEARHLSFNTVITKLHIVNLMEKLKDYVGSGLSFKFYWPGDLQAIAKKIGKPNKRTKTIKPDDFFYLLDKSLSVISDSENVDNCIEKLDRIIALKSVYCRNFTPHYKKEYGESTILLYNQLRVTYASAIVVLLSLTAMRKHEATLISYEDAVLSLNDNEYLRGTETKTSGTATGKETKRPLPEEAKTAIIIILKLTKYTRETTESDRLLLRLPFSHSVSKEHVPDYEMNTRTLYNLLDNLAESFSLSHTLRPHMLRRAFALIWTWRFELGDLEHLSKFLYHNNHEFTKAYIDDPDVYQYLPAEMQTYTAQIFEKAFFGDVPIKGGAEKIIQRYQRLIRQKVTVLAPELLSSFIEHIIKKFGYQVIPNADGYCFMANGRGSRAMCSTDGKQPDYSNRNEEHCANCPNFGVDESRVEYWEKRRDAHVRVFNTSKDSLLLESSKDGVKRADRIISMFREVK
jgi:integrase